MVLRAVQRVALQLPPRRAAKSVKIARISRAEGGQLQAPVGWQPSEGFLMSKRTYALLEHLPWRYAFTCFVHVVALT